MHEVIIHEAKGRIKTLHNTLQHLTEEIFGLVGEINELNKQKAAAQERFDAYAALLEDAGVAIEV